MPSVNYFQSAEIVVFINFVLLEGRIATLLIWP